MARDDRPDNSPPVTIFRRDECGLREGGDSPDESQATTQVIYDASSDICHPGKLLKNMIADVLSGRELAWRLFVRNLRGMYRQTLLGFFWAFLPPLVNTAFWVFFRRVAEIDSPTESVNPAVYILTGMIFWQAFIDAFQMPLAELNKNRNMISKLNFPRESLLMVGLGEVIFNLAIRLLLLIPAFLYFSVPVHASLLLVPVVALALILLGAGLGLLLLPAGSLYQDVGRFVSMAIPFWMILTPVVYPPLSGFPGTILNWLNPASPLIIVARDWTLQGTTSFGTLGWLFGLGSLPLFLAGWILFRISMPVLIERMNA